MISQLSSLLAQTGPPSQPEYVGGAVVAGLALMALIQVVQMIKPFVVGFSKRERNGAAGGNGRVEEFWRWQTGVAAEQAAVHRQTVDTLQAIATVQARSVELLRDIHDTTDGTSRAVEQIPEQLAARMEAQRLKWERQGRS